MNGSYSILQISEALGLNRSSAVRRAAKEGWPYDEEPARGGMRRIYPLETLPQDVQVALLVKFGTGDDEPEPEPDLPYDRDALWEWASTRSEKQRAKGREKARLLRMVMALVDNGMPLLQAFSKVAAAEGVSARTMQGWYQGTRGKMGAKHYARADWDAALVPGHVGRTAEAEFDPAAWDWCRSYYLTRNGPSMAEAAIRTIETAAKNGWRVPAKRTIERRLEQIPEAVRVYQREGAEALRRLLPWQRRDKRSLGVGEYVSGDGVKFDKIWVDWGDEIINTTTAWIWQDVYSGRLLAHRVAKTENTDLFRLATYDLLAITVPRVAQIDNTTVAANKAMTAGAKGRHRFKSRDDDPLGILLQLDIYPQFTNPDHTQSNPGVKPIERAFRDLHEAVRQNPKLLNRGYSKATAVPIDEFRAIVAEEIKRHNARKGRRTAVCGGKKSFDDVFFAAYEKAAVRRATETQRQLLLLMPEVVYASKAKGEIQLKAGAGPTGKPRYWSEELIDHRASKLVAYYDPENLDQPLQVYTLAGQHICAAERISDTGFNDTAAAREWSKFNRRRMTALKKIAEDQVRMDALEVAAHAPDAPDDLEIPDPGVVQGNFRQKTRVQDGRVVGNLAEAVDAEEFDDVFANNLSSLVAAKKQESLDWDETDEDE